MHSPHAIASTTHLYPHEETYFTSSDHRHLHAHREQVSTKDRGPKTRATFDFELPVGYVLWYVMDVVVV